MADSTDEVVPAGWEKRTSRSTGIVVFSIFCNKSISTDRENVCEEIAFVMFECQNATFFFVAQSTFV